MFNLVTKLYSIKTLIDKYLGEYSLPLNDEMEDYFRKVSYADGSVSITKKITLEEGRSSVEIGGLIRSKDRTFSDFHSGSAIFYKLEMEFHKFSCGYFEYLDKTIGSELKESLVEHSKIKDEDILTKDRISIGELMNEVLNDYSTIFLAKKKMEEEREIEEEEKKRESFHSAKPTEKTRSALDKYRNSDIRDTVETLRKQMES